MEPVFYSIENGEKWLTPFEKRQWREKYKALQRWFDKKGIESSPWLQVRIREFLIITSFIQRLEQELLLSSTSSKVESKIEGNDPHKKVEKISSSIQSYEVLFKYFERQRKLVQEFEELKPTETKTSPMSIAELVQDLANCAREWEKGNGKMQEETIQLEEDNKAILNCER